MFSSLNKENTNKKEKKKDFCLMDSPFFDIRAVIKKNHTTGGGI